MRLHKLKTWPEYFAALLRGDKTFEVRRDDRSYDVGDVLHLVEWDPTEQDELTRRSVGETGRVLRAVISYKVPGGRFGIGPEMCVLGLRDVRELLDK